LDTLCPEEAKIEIERAMKIAMRKASEKKGRMCGVLVGIFSTTMGTGRGTGWWWTQTKRMGTASSLR
jgi:hypothetical protein